MRLLRKLVIKLITMVITVAVLGGLLRYAKPYIMKSAGMPEGMPSTEGIGQVHFASEESDLMGTIFKSALKLFTGQAKRDELAGELSSKLYGGSDSSNTRAELGIELVRPDGKPNVPVELPKPGANSPAQPATVANLPSSAKSVTTGQNAPAAGSPTTQASNKIRDALLGRVLEKAKANPELSLIPLVLLVMLVVHLFRRGRAPEDDFMIPDLTTLIPSEAEAYEMTHPVHALQAEHFELLVGLIYQRQGYRVTMPAGLGGGRIIVQRKSEKLLIQCKKLSPDHKVHVDRVRELHEAAATAGVTRGVYVATCGFSWDARNFAKAKGVTVINARILDTLLTGARAKPDEDFLAVSDWAPKLMKKVTLTPPLCPACEGPMDELKVSDGSVWLCGQRPECRGRRSARKFDQPTSAVAAKAEAKAKPKATPEGETSPLPEVQPEVRGGRARTVSPSTSPDEDAQPSATSPREKWQPPEVLPGPRAQTACSSATSRRSA